MGAAQGDDQEKRLEEDEEQETHDEGELTKTTRGKKTRTKKKYEEQETHNEGELTKTKTKTETEMRTKANMGIKDTRWG